jgi:hypothetical protein
VIFGINGKKSHSSYTLTVTRGFAMLKENTAFSDFLDIDTRYKFYEYFRPCTGCTTVIKLNTSSHKRYHIYATFGNLEKISSHKNYMKKKEGFELDTRTSDQLVITPEMLKAKNHVDKTGYFLIEVHARRPMNYTISVVSNKSMLKPISRGQQVDFSISGPTDDVYFIYKHESSKGFQIEIQERSGFSETLVNAVPENENPENHLPSDQTHAQWSTYQTYDREKIEISPSSSTFCKK